MQAIPEKVRVLHVLPNFVTGGAEMLVKSLLLSYDNERFEVTACSLYAKSGTMIERVLDENGIKVFYLNKQLGPDPKTIIEIYKVFKLFRPHIVHTHRYIIRYTLIPSIICRIPVRIHTVHNIADKEVDTLGKIIHKIAFKKFNICPIGISREISKTIEQLYDMSSVPFIYNGIPTEVYKFTPALRIKIRKALSIDDNQFVIIHIGRFSPQKNHKLLIESFSKISSKISNVLLLLIGDGTMIEEIKALVRDKGLGSKVRFLGIRKDIPELLSASDLFVLSSDWEGVPLVVLEAMAASRPIIATAVGGVPELIIDGINGILINPNDADALTQAIIKIITTPKIAQTMSEKASFVFKDRFDSTLMTKHYQSIYETKLRKHEKTT